MTDSTKSNKCQEYKTAIGGMFGLLQIESSSTPQAPSFLSKPHLLLATARSAFKLLSDFLKPNTVWLPSYLCSSITDATSSHKMSFYEIDEHLQVANVDWLSKIQAMV